MTPTTPGPTPCGAGTPGSPGASPGGGGGLPEQLQRGIDEVALLHVDLHANTELLGPFQDHVQVRGTRRTVDGEPQLGQLQRDRRVDSPLADSLHGLQIPLRRLARTVEVPYPLTEQVQDAGDPPRVQVDRRGYRVRQACPRDEPLHRLTGQRIVGHELLQPRVFRSPQQKLIDHVRTPISCSPPRRPRYQRSCWVIEGDEPVMPMPTLGVSERSSRGQGRAAGFSTRPSRGILEPPVRPRLIPAAGCRRFPKRWFPPPRASRDRFRSPPQRRDSRCSREHRSAAWRSRRTSCATTVQRQGPQRTARSNR